MKTKAILGITFSTLAFCFVGCVQMPNVLHPGHISAQQDRMKQFDPFARTDVGPKIPGDRPSGSTQRTPTVQHLDKYKK